MNAPFAAARTSGSGVVDGGDDWVSDDLTPPDGSAWDLLVIGGGTAGLVAAKTAAGFGASVLMVEPDRIGGDCLWTGCVPSKALLAAAHAAHDAADAARFGVDVGVLAVDFARVMDGVTRAIAAIAPTDSPPAMRAAGVTLAHARARFTAAHEARVGTESVAFRQAVITTGSAPARPAVPGLDQVDARTNETIFDLRVQPKSLLVIGGGSIGCELGQAFARLGSRVTIVEAGPRLLAREDADASALIHAALTADGVDVRTGVSVRSVRPASVDGGPEAVLSDEDVLAFDVVLLATGRTPDTGGLDLAAAGVETDERGYIKVNRRLRTTNRHVWAAGDVSGQPQFTHTAGVHGTLVAGNAILGLRRRVDESANPRVTFTQPELAAFGVDVDRARELGWTVRTVTHDLVDRAITERHENGFSRLVLDGRGRIVGATVVGPRAGESLPEAVLAARQGLRARDLAAATHAYPTYSDGLWKASIAQVQSQLDAPMVQGLVRAATGARRRWVSR